MFLRFSPGPFMIIKDIKYKKGKNILKISTPFCECGSAMRFVGGAGCEHDMQYTYFIQCCKCMKVESTSMLPMAFLGNYEDIEGYGWKKVR